MSFKNSRLEDGLQPAEYGSDDKAKDEQVDDVSKGGVIASESSRVFQGTKIAPFSLAH